MASDLASDDERREPAVTAPRQVQRRLDAKQIASLVKLYLSGESVSELARQFRVHRTTVMAQLDRHGVPRRPQLRKLTDEQVQAAAAMYCAGNSTVAVGDHFDVDAATVQRALKKVGVEMRPPGRWRA